MINVKIMKRLNSGKINVLLALLLIAGCSGSSAPKQALEEYIGAMKAGNFKTVYELNATAQKKVVLAYRGAKSGVDGRLKKEFAYYQDLYNTVSEESSVGGQWKEKLFFPAASNHSITAINVKEESGSPTAKFKAHEYALAELTIEYSDKKTAPSVGGQKVKKISCDIKMIKGEDAVKGLPTDVKLRKWLFKSLTAKREGATYW